MAAVNDIAIDLGTSHVVIYMKGKGIQLTQPAYVAINNDTQNIIAVGDEAEQMAGKTPTNIFTVRPLRDGTISDFDLCRQMLRQLVVSVVGKRIFSRPRAVMALPTNVNDTEKRALISTMFDAGMRRTQLVNRCIAAAIGAEKPIDDARGVMIVDISAGTTDIAVLSKNQIVVSDCVNIGGDRFDEAIIRHIRRKHHLKIGEKTAEMLKESIGSAIPRNPVMKMDATGINTVSGLPKTIAITSDDILEAIEEPLLRLIDAIHEVLIHTPAELAYDIFDNGITLTGGGASLFGIAEAIADTLNVKVETAYDPAYCIANGLAKIIDEPARFAMYIDDTRKHSFH